MITLPKPKYPPFSYALLDQITYEAMRYYDWDNVQWSYTAKATPVIKLVIFSDWWLIVRFLIWLGVTELPSHPVAIQGVPTEVVIQRPYQFHAKRIK